jgi:hypothetical protein
MAKRQSFADKASKKVSVAVCPVCSSQIEYLRVVDPTYVESKKAWKLKDKLVGICKCNEKEILA